MCGGDASETKINSPFLSLSLSIYCDARVDHRKSFRWKFTWWAPLRNRNAATIWIFPAPLSRSFALTISVSVSLVFDGNECWNSVCSNWSCVLVCFTLGRSCHAIHSIETSLSFCVLCMRTVRSFASARAPNHLRSPTSWTAAVRRTLWWTWIHTCRRCRSLVALCTGFGLFQFF